MRTLAAVAVFALLLAGCGGPPLGAPGAPEPLEVDAGTNLAPDALPVAPQADAGAVPEASPGQDAGRAPEAAPAPGPEGSAPTADAGAPEVRPAADAGDAGSSPDPACYSPTESMPSAPISRTLTVDCGSGCQDAYAAPSWCTAAECTGPAAPYSVGPLGQTHQNIDQTLLFAAVNSHSYVGPGGGGCSRCTVTAWSFTVQALDGASPFGACVRVTASEGRFVVPDSSSVCASAAGERCAVVLARGSVAPYVTVAANVGTPQGWVRLEAAALASVGGVCPLACP